MRHYEGMFLFDPAAASSWENVQAELDRLMSRAEARLISSSKWDERRLAYEIRGRKRGVYALTYFEADTSKLKGLERDAELSESILRYMVLRADHMTEDEMRQAAAPQQEKPQAEAPAEQETPQPAATEEAPAAAQSGQGDEVSVETPSAEEKPAGETGSEQQ